MDDDLWDAIQKSFVVITSGIANRVDGNGFIIYRAGSIIRIDIKVEDGKQ